MWCYVMYIWCYMMLYDVIWCYMGKIFFLQADLTVSWWKKGTFFLHGEISSIFTFERIETGFLQLRFWTSRPTEQKVWKMSQLLFGAPFLEHTFFEIGWNRRLYPLFQFFQIKNLHTTPNRKNSTGLWSSSNLLYFNKVVSAQLFWITTIEGQT